MTDDAGEDVRAALEGTWRVGQRVLVVHVPHVPPADSGVPYVGTIVSVNPGFDVYSQVTTRHLGATWWVELDRDCRRIEGES